MFASEHFGLEPDIVTLAKGIASGMPLGALLARDEVMQWYERRPRLHVRRQPRVRGRGPRHVPTAGGRTRGERGDHGEAYSSRAFEKGLGSHARVGDVRGLGLMIGVEIVKDRTSREPAPDLREKILEEAFRRGLLLLGCGKSTIRLAPPLVIDREDAELAVGILEESIRAVG